MKCIVVGQDVNQALYHVGHQVDTNQIVQAKNTSFRDTHRTTKQRIRFQWLEPKVESRMQGALNRKNSNPIAQKPRGIEAGDDTLTQLLFAKLAQDLDYRRVSLFTTYQFKQAHKTHRVKEMRNRKSLTKYVWHIFDQQSNRNCGGIRGNNCLVVTYLIEALVKCFFDIESFHDCLGHPITIGQLMKIIASIPQVYKRLGIFAH